jgi:hypothetical protein
MRIIKVKQNGLSGKTLLMASTFVVRPALSDSYTVTFEAQGIDSSGDAQTYRLSMSRNELRTLNQFADLSREEP